jgi:hypothetical protein
MLKLEMAYNAYNEHKLDGVQFGEIIKNELNILRGIVMVFKDYDDPFTPLNDDEKVLLHKLVKSLEFKGFV